MKKFIAYEIVLALGVSLWSPVAWSDNYPFKPITMVVPFAAGGSADVVGRVLAKQLGEELGQPIVFDIKAGAGSMIGSELVAQAKPDGYTILFTGNPLAINVSLMKLRFDPTKELVPVAGIVGFPALLVTSRDGQFKTVSDLLNAPKATQLTYGSSGLGTFSHMSGELFQALTGSNLTHVPYKGSGAVYPDLMAGRVTLLFDVAASALGFAKSGQVRALAVTSKERLKTAPEVPTLMELGVKGYESLSWFGVFAPKGTPPAVISRLEKALNKVVASTEFSARLEQWGGLPLYAQTADQFNKFYLADVNKWAELVRNGLVKPLQ